MTRQPARLLLAVLLSLLALSSRTSHAAPPSPAPAAPPDDSPSARAGKLRAVANQAMLDMHYADALALYVQAHELVPEDATVLYSMARASEFLGDFPVALESLEEFSRGASSDAKKRVGQLDGLLAQLRARVSTLNLRCSVPGARVLVRGRFVGTTPLPPLRLTAGAANVEVELDGYFTAHRDISLPGEGNASVELELRKRTTSGVLTVTTTPLGAQVFVDGTLAGTSSPRLELGLDAGSHRVVARRDGYDEAAVPLVLAPGSSREISVSLEPSVPLTRKWWFWTGVGVIVVGGVVTTAALLTERSGSHGSLPPGQVSAPLRF